MTFAVGAAAVCQAAAKSQASPLTGTFSGSGTIPVGSLVVITVTEIGVSAFSSVTDNAGNAYARPQGSGTSPGTSIYWAVTTHAITRGTTTLSVAWTGGLTRTLGFTADWFTVTSGQAAVDLGVAASGTSTTPTTGNATGTHFGNELIYGGVGVLGPTADTYTEASTFTTAGSTGTNTGTSDITVHSGYILNAASGTVKDYNPTLGTSRAWGDNYITFNEPQTPGNVLVTGPLPQSAPPSPVPSQVIVPFPVGLLRNDFEEGTNGTTISTVNSGGGPLPSQAFDGVTIGASATVTYDSTQKAHGQLSAKVTTPAVATFGFVFWGSKLQAGHPTVYFRAYFYLPALPPTGTRLITLWNTTAAATLVDAVTVNAAGQLAWATAGTAMSTVLPVGAWFRVEGFLSGPGSPNISLSLFTSMDSQQAIETISSAHAGYASVGSVGFGISNSIASATYWIDDIGVSINGPLGPAGSTAAQQALQAPLQPLPAPVVPSQLILVAAGSAPVVPPALVPLLQGEPVPPGAAIPVLPQIAPLVPGVGIVKWVPPVEAILTPPPPPVIPAQLAPLVPGVGIVRWVPPVEAILTPPPPPVVPPQIAPLVPGVGIVRWVPLVEGLLTPGPAPVIEPQIAPLAAVTPPPPPALVPLLQPPPPSPPGPPPIQPQLAPIGTPPVQQPSLVATIRPLPPPPPPPAPIPPALAPLAPVAPPPPPVVPLVQAPPPPPPPGTAPAPQLAPLGPTAPAPAPALIQTPVLPGPSAAPPPFIAALAPPPVPPPPLVPIFHPLPSAPFYAPPLSELLPVLIPPPPPPTPIAGVFRRDPPPFVPPPLIPPWIYIVLQPSPVPPALQSAEGLARAKGEPYLATVTDPETGVATATDPRSGTATVAPSAGGPASATDPRSGTATTGAAAGGVPTVTTAPDSATVTDPNAGSRAAAGDPRSGTATVTENTSGTGKVS